MLTAALSWSAFSKKPVRRVVAWLMIDDEVILAWIIDCGSWNVERGTWNVKEARCMVVGPGGKKFFIFTSISRGGQEMVAKW